MMVEALTHQCGTHGDGQQMQPLQLMPAKNCHGTCRVQKINRRCDFGGVNFPAGNIPSGNTWVQHYLQELLLRQRRFPKQSRSSRRFPVDLWKHGATWDASNRQCLKSSLARKERAPRWSCWSVSHRSVPGIRMAQCWWNTTRVTMVTMPMGLSLIRRP